MNLLFTVMSEILGGAELHALQLAAKLKERGHRCHVVCSSRNKAQLEKLAWSEREDIPVDVAANYDHVADYIDKHQPDVVQHYNSLEVVAGIELARHRPLSVQILHANHALEEDYRHVYTDYTDRLVAVSDSVKRFYPARESCPPISVILNGVDIEQFRPDPLGEEAREGLRFLTVARLNDPSKRTIEVIESFQKIAKEHWHLHIVGGGPDSLGLSTKLQSYGLSNVSLSDFTNDIQKIYRQSDVYICGSRTEGFGLALVEAAACGLAIVTTACHGVTELFTHRENAMIASTWSDLESALEELGDSPELRKKLRQNARDYCSDKLTIRKMVDDYEQLYLDMLVSKCNGT